MRPPAVRRWIGAQTVLAVPFVLLAVLASWSPAGRSAAPDPQALAAMPLDCDPAALAPADANACRAKRRNEGQRLFDRETFGGNGRTCVTCHAVETGTFSPEDAQARLLLDPDDPLFRHDGLDEDGGTSRILEHATVTITLPLPPHLTLLGGAGVTHVTVRRGTPTTMNTPALDPALMHDLRDADLKVQALGAIRGHAQNTIEPTDLQLELIAEFQRTAPRFFSHPRLRRFAGGGEPPALPMGSTPSEQRGRLFFIDAPFAPPSKVGICALCHSGPMLDQANGFVAPVLGTPEGTRIQNVGVSEANVIGNPVHTFLVHDGLGDPVPVTTPDIGILFTDPADAPLLAATLPPKPVLEARGARLAFFANFFKIPTLWGVADTAPYFHDNSAKTLDEMLAQYDFFFETRLRGQVALTPQDKEDIKAFLRLLK